VSPTARPSRRAILALAAAGAVWPGSAAWAQSGTRTVVATTGMVADAVRQVGGSRVKVVQLMGAGVDPHSYRQTRSDIAQLVRADMVVWHGLYLEAQMEAFLLDLGKRKAVAALGEAVPVHRRRAHDEYPNRFDPHVWMDPRLWRFVVDAARDALSKFDPGGAGTYAANAAKHLEAIDRLAAYSDQVLATVPAERRVLVTAHDAFNYFGRAYGYAVEGIQGISTESEAGLKRIQELVDLIVQKKLSAVFVESSVADRNVRALIEGAAARGHKVIVGGELFSDAMGPDGTYEGTYIGMIDHNVTVVARALGGTAPPRGMDGRLTHVALAP
jgi:manganese/zinc/iron transport system substrate-binding protein